MSVQGGRREKGRRLPPPGVASLSSRASARDVSDGVEAADRWAERGRAALGLAWRRAGQRVSDQPLPVSWLSGLEVAVRA